MRRTWNDEQVRIGKPFGDWTVIGTPFCKYKKWDWYIRCRCTCGNEYDVVIRNLLKGRSTRCLPCAKKSSSESRRKGTLATDGKKTCARCLMNLDVANFPQRTNSPDGYYIYCNRCLRIHHLSQYGLTEDDFDVLMVIQNYSCAICNKPFGDDETPQVEHCHVTGSVRSLSCSKCNRAFGLLGECPEIIRRLLEYAEKWQSVKISLTKR